MKLHFLPGCMNRGKNHIYCRYLEKVSVANN